MLQETVPSSSFFFLRKLYTYVLAVCCTSSMIVYIREMEAGNREIKAVSFYIINEIVVLSTESQDKSDKYIRPS